MNIYSSLYVGWLQPTAFKNRRGYLTETDLILLCYLVAALGVFAVLAAVSFGPMLSIRSIRYRKTWEELLAELTERDASPHLAQAYVESLQRRNEIWNSYGQILIAILIVTVLTIMMLAGKVSAEAGLPIISGVSGFALAKGVAGGKASVPQDRR